jgi:O-antigen ligase
MDYAIWDYKQFVQGVGGHYPDSERLVSMQVGLAIGNEHPLLGVGAGDLDQAVKAFYQKHFEGTYNFRMPHNQLITVYAGTGAIGLAIFLAAFFFPVFYKKNYRNPLFLAFHAIVFMSFLMESTVENNFGVSLYLFFLLIGLNYMSDKNGWQPKEKGHPF